MEDTQIKLECSGSKNYVVSDMDWFRLQAKILKHMVRNASFEKWEDIFDPQELTKIRQDMKIKNCPGLAYSRYKYIDIGICQGCGLCETAPLQCTFRQKLYEYIQNALQKDTGSHTQGRHSHGKNRLCAVSDEGVAIRLKKTEQGRFVFRTVFIGSEDGDQFSAQYLQATPASRHLILKDIALQRANGCLECIHYRPNFRK